MLWNTKLRKVLQTKHHAKQKNMTLMNPESTGERIHVHSSSTAKARFVPWTAGLGLCDLCSEHCTTVDGLCVKCKRY